MKLTEKDIKQIKEYTSPYVKTPFIRMGMILTEADRKVLKGKGRTFGKCLGELLEKREMTRVQLENHLGYSLFKNTEYDAQPNEKKLIDIGIVLKLSGEEFEELCECGNHRITNDWHDPISMVYAKFCDSEISDEIKYNKLEIDELIYLETNKHYYQ